LARRLLIAYLAVLLLSHTVSWLRGSVAPEVKPGHRVVELALREGKQALPRTMRLSFRDVPAEDPQAATLVLLHGSPGDGDSFRAMADALQGKYRLIVPDLPGFGASERRLPDYSFEAHAAALSELLDALQIKRAHIVAFSMGGGVALHLAHAEPARVVSLTMMAAIGVQELELFGKYELNHAVHGFQLVAFQALAWLTPHFGALRPGNGAINYARNFYDSDQRPLRGYLESWQGPTLILHGQDDPLVPVAAAYEHARIVPQAQAEIWSGVSHFMPWKQTEDVTNALSLFVDAAENGDAATRARAKPEAIALAQQPWNPSDAPELVGFALVIMMILLAAATLVTEDLTCIFTGLLIAQGRIDFLFGTAACFIGILIGDGMLFLLGRWLGRPALARAPLRWMVRPRAVYRASSWFEHRGGKVILLSRFLPGLRLPTYVAAGMLGQSLRTFFFYFALAGLIWTPLLVGVSTWAGKEVLEGLRAVEGYALPILVLLALGIFLAQKLIVPVFTRRGRRLLYGSIRRKLEWEFWPPQIFYLPVVLQILWLAVRYRGLRLVTAVNPGIPTGGLVGEGKWQIFAALGMDPDAPEGARGPAASSLPRSLLIAGMERTASSSERLRLASAYLTRHQLSYPVILKPDRGERGHGVELIRDAKQLARRLRIDRTALILQEFVPGLEFGVFYVREPGAAQGKILSINGKQMLKLNGDGQRTLEQLILDDDRAVRLAEVHFEYHAERLYEVPAAGESIDLVEVGAHARGTIFLDRRDLMSEALRARIDEIASAFPGFHFGRFDLRVPDETALREGRALRILELNGLTAEVAHIYDPANSLFSAWRDIMHQWRLAFAIAAANRRAGARPSSWGEILSDWGRARREHRTRDQALLEAEIAEEEARQKPATAATPAPSTA
jgi:pimeloyl-ACP methyl ester carboxylesterase/membrane protein DedA with SNARE-associated domain